MKNPNKITAANAEITLSQLLLQPGGQDREAPPSGPEEPADFPTDALPPVAARIVREAAKAVLVPESLTGAVALAVGAASVGGGLEVESGGKRRTRGNLFLLPIAESGTGKDAAFNAVAFPLRDLQKELAEEWRDEILPGLHASLAVAEEEVKNVRKGIKTEQDPDARMAGKKDLESAERKRREAEAALRREPCLYITEPTREALVEYLNGQAGEAGAVLTPESRGVLSVLNGRYTSGKSTDEDVYCAGFSGTPCRERRKGREGMDLSAPCLTALFMVQPDRAGELFGDEAMRESGLLPRFLAFDSKAVAEDLPETPAEVSDEAEEEWAARVRRLAETFRLSEDPPQTIKAAPGALAAMRDYDNETRRRRRPGGDLADVAIFASRWAEQAWRLSVVLHAMRHGPEAGAAELSAETARAAIRLARWFAERQLEVLHRGRMERMHRKVGNLLAVLAQAHGEMTLRDLHRRHGWNPEEARMLAGRFPELVRIEERKPEGGGRPSSVAVAAGAPATP